MQISHKYFGIKEFGQMKANSKYFFQCGGFGKSKRTPVGII